MRCWMNAANGANRFSYQSMCVPPMPGFGRIDCALAHFAASSPTAFKVPIERVSRPLSLRHHARPGGPSTLQGTTSP